MSLGQHALKLEVERFLQAYSFFPRVTFEAGSIMVRERDQADSSGAA